MSELYAIQESNMLHLVFHCCKGRFQTVSRLYKYSHHHNHSLTLCITKIINTWVFIQINTVQLYVDDKMMIVCMCILLEHR